jgi:hypothetical protein
MGAIVQEFVGGILTFIVYGLIFAGVYKLYHMATDLSEMKDLLRDIRRNTEDGLKPIAGLQPVSQLPQTANGSPDELLRALRDQNYPLDYPAGHAKEQPVSPSLSEPR